MMRLSLSLQSAKKSETDANTVHSFEVKRSQKYVYRTVGLDRPHCWDSLKLVRGDRSVGRTVDPLRMHYLFRLNCNGIFSV